MGQTNAQVRVVDAVLTKHIQGYQQAGHVGHNLFPKVTVEKSGGTRIEFGKEAFILAKARRAPGTNTKRVKFGYEGKPYALVQDALEGVVPIEHMRESSGLPSVDLAKTSSNTVMSQLTLLLEKEQADLATDVNNYDASHKVTLSGVAKWSDVDSDPVGDIATGKDQIRKTIGLNPNTLVISASVFKALKQNNKIKSYHQNKDGAPVIVNAEMLAEIFEVGKVIVGDAVFVDDTGNFTDVWGDNAVLAYVGSQNPNLQEPSYGYTYALPQHPFVEEPYYAETAKSWIYPTTYERAPVIVSSTSGYLISAVI